MTDFTTADLAAMLRAADAGAHQGQVEALGALLDGLVPDTDEETTRQTAIDLLQVVASLLVTVEAAHREGAAGTRWEEFVASVSGPV